MTKFEHTTEDIRVRNDLNRAAKLLGHDFLKEAVEYMDRLRRFVHDIEREQLIADKIAAGEPIGDCSGCVAAQHPCIDACKIY